MKISAGAIVAAACFSIVQSQPRAVEHAPESIFGLYAPPSARTAGQDNIRITRRRDGTIDVALKLYYANGHTCQLNKPGEWLGDHVLISAEGLDQNQPCKLEASFSKGHVLLKDDGLRCAPVYCGTRGKLDGVSLPKRH